MKFGDQEFPAMIIAFPPGRHPTIAHKDEGIDGASLFKLGQQLSLLGFGEVLAQLNNEHPPEEEPSKIVAATLSNCGRCHADLMKHCRLHTPPCCPGQCRGPG